MGEAEMSMLKKTLKRLCRSNGWSYGVFWRFDQRNSMLLTLEDAYYEESMEAVIENMLLQVHMLGEGIIGRAAFTGKHRWMFSDTHSGEWNSDGSIGSQDIFQDDYEFHCQFSLGIKTIAVISVESRGVILFGSTQKILETSDFLDQTKSLSWEMETVEGIIPLDSVPSSLNAESYDLNGLFASLVTSENSYNGNLKAMHGDSCQNPTGKACSSSNLTWSSPFISESHHGRMTSVHWATSHLSNQFGQFQIASAEAPLILPNKPSYQFQQVFLQSASSVNNSAVETPCISTWSTEDSILTSLEMQVPSEVRVQDLPSALPSKENALVSQSSQGDSTFTSFYKAGGLVGGEKTIQVSSGKLMDNWHSIPLIHATEGDLQERSTSPPRFPEELKPADFTVDFSESFPMDNLSQWFVPLPEHSINLMAAKLADGLSQSIGVSTVSSGLVGDDILVNIPVEHPANSVQSCIINPINSDGRDKSFNLHGSETNHLDGFGNNLGSGIAGACWEDILMPVASTGVSECISQLDVNSMADSKKGLFSELGLKELLNGIGNYNSVTKSSFENQQSAIKRRRSESSTVNTNQLQLTRLSCSGGDMISTPPVHEKDVPQKSQVGLWIDDSYSINAGRAVIAQPKKPVEPTKGTRKRARPGESTRPRPKDRQQIQDRLEELRGIIPNGHKSSIDSLLDRTIKYMLFLQSVTKYADKLKQTDEPKLIDQENGVVVKDNNSVGGGVGGGGGATWAFEVGGQAMICPIIVEDLSTPGQMLIEMLCEDRGFFLEIADVVRGFGLIILKGVMEVRKDKIWARFIVEANRHVTRMDIFWSLLQLLQQTATSKATDSGIPPLNNYEQPLAPLPMSLAETLQ